MGNTYKNTVLERDLGMRFDDTYKFSNQCSVAVRNANMILWLIRCNIVYKNKIRNKMAKYINNNSRTYINSYQLIYRIESTFDQQEFQDRIFLTILF